MSAISLHKGQRVRLDKNGDIIVSNGWTADGKDYDLKGLVRYRDGRAPIYVGAANLDEVLSIPEGAVRHGGDVTEPGARETMTVSWHPDVASVALSSYSALENGTGSFMEYGVFVEIANGPQVVGIAAADASAEGTSYTLCFGEVLFNDDGSLTVINHELYSAANSEHRVGYRGDQVVMDIGPVGQPK